MRNKLIFRLLLVALFTALSFVLGKVLMVPLPGAAGNGFYLLDAGVFTAALLFGKKEGAFVGAVAGFLVDFTAGSPYMLFSLVAHGTQGFAGALTKNRLVNYVLSSACMVGVYFAADLLLNYSPKAGLLHSWPIALPDLLINLIQTSVGFALALLIQQILKRLGVLKKYGFD